MRVIKTVIVILMLVLTNHNVLAEDDQASASTTSKASKNGTPPKSSGPLAISSASDTIPTVVMGYCHPIPNGETPSSLNENTLTPNTQAKEFLNYQEHHAIDGTTNTSILMEPKHGALHKVTEDNAGKYYSDSASLDLAVSYFVYIPEKGFAGKDSATFLVDFGTVRVKVVYSLQVTDENMISECDHSCEKGQWEISSTLHSNNAYKTLQPLTFAVVVKKYTVPANGNSEATTYQPGDMLTFDRSSDDGKVHVNSYSGGDGWIPRKNIATKDQFTKVNSWRGVSSAAYEGIDDGSTYTIQSDGSIESTHGDRCGNVTLKGHLYRFKNILWMRDEQNGDLSGSNSFMILPGGELCSLAFPCPIGKE